MAGRNAGYHLPGRRWRFLLIPNTNCYFGKSYDMHSIVDRNDFCTCILKQSHINLASGVAFKAPQSKRISYSNSLDRLYRFLDLMQADLA